MTRCLFLAMLLLLPAAAASAQTPDPQDYRLILRVPRQEADLWLREEIARSGGKFEEQRYHFVIGFSTGHYGSDPVHAIAMRRLAFSLLNNSFAPGDRVTAVGWEMDVWHKGDMIPLTGDPRSRARFVDDVPYAPREGSRGGHDTERALYETLKAVVPEPDAKNTVVLLLTNNNQSQGPTGARAQLFGANNRQLADLLQRRGYRRPLRHSFTAATRNDQLTIDVTAAFPKQIESIRGVPATPRFPTFAFESWQPPADRPAAAAELPNKARPMTEAAPAPVTPPAVTTQPEAPEKGGIPWPLILVGLLVIGGVAWLLFRPKGKPQEAVEKAAPAGRPLPGAVNATIGSAPRESKSSFTKLTSASRWTLLREGDGVPTLTDAEDAPGARLAVLSFEPRGRLQLAAEGDTLFHDIKGIDITACTNRLLLVAPGDRIVCRVASAASAQDPVRVELSYQKEG